MAGVTKKFTGSAKIHENPRIYVYDAPGVLVPWFGDDEESADRAMMVALTSAWLVSSPSPVPGRTADSLQPDVW
jgi:hypothetical protein